MGTIKFNFENLEVWQRAVKFAVTVLSLSDKINFRQKHFRLIEQLESASTSVALNIAEGQGRYSKREFIHFLYVARGSLYETITLLIVLNRYNCISDKELMMLRVMTKEIGKMLSGLINSIKNSISANLEPRTSN